MNTKGTVSDYMKANRKGSREAELDLSAGWTAKTKVHKSRKHYDRKGQNWKSDSDLFGLIGHNFASIPPKPLHPNDETDRPKRGEGDGGRNNLHPACAFVEDAADAVGQCRQGQHFDGSDAPFGKIVVTEKYARQYHHRQLHGIYPPGADFRFGGAARNQYGNAREGDIARQKECKQRPYIALNLNIEQ